MVARIIDMHDRVPEPPPGMFEDEKSLDQSPATPTWDRLVVPVPSDWYTTVPPARTWLLRDGRSPRLDGVLPLGKVAGLISAGGVGKTMLICDLLACVATGSRWIRTFPATKGRAISFFGEEDPEECQRRTYNTNRGKTELPAAGDVVVVPLAGVPCAFLERDERGNTSETAFLSWVRDYVVKTGPWALIVIDPLSRFAGPEAEKDNAQGTRFIQALESIATATGATVLFSHHTPKGESGRGGRGSSSIFDGCRWEAMLEAQRVSLDDPDTRERLGELVTLNFTKSNYAKKADALVLRRAEGGPLVPLDDVDADLVAEATSGATERKAKAVAKRDETSSQRQDDDRALVGLLNSHPEGLLAGDIRSLLPFSKARADQAAARIVLAGLAHVIQGDKNAKRYFVGAAKNNCSPQSANTEGQ
jgi:RecA-family ATPase